MKNLLGRLENFLVTDDEPVKSEKELQQEGILKGLTNRINNLIVNETGMTVTPPSPNSEVMPVVPAASGSKPQVTSGTDTDASNPAHVEFIKALQPIMDKVAQKQPVSWGELEHVKSLHDKVKDKLQVPNMTGTNESVSLKKKGIRS
jgi:hypothetical protein